MIGHKNGGVIIDVGSFTASASRPDACNYCRPTR